MTTNKRSKNNHKPKPKPKPQINTHLQLSDVIPVLISSTSAAHSFLLRHDLRLLPSQSLLLESLLSSTSLSLSHLFSLLPPQPPQPNPHPPPQQNTFNTFLSSSPDHDPRWVSFFNLSKPSFTLLLRLLTPSLTSSLHHPMSPATALAATLFRLAHGASFSAVGRRFGIDSETACRGFYAVCKAVLENLGHLFEFSSDLNRVIVGFGWISLPNCCGVLGIERFEVEGGNGCLLVQALVDSEGRFLDVSAGWPGVKKPEDVLKRSKLYLGVEETKECLSGPEFELSGGCLIPQYVLGDSCFPLLPWLLTPFSDKNEEELGCSEMAFNEVHRRGMELVGAAFGGVKKRWKLVGKKWKENCIEAFPFVIVACCLLHNFLIKCSEEFPEEDVESSRDGEFPEFDGEEDESGRRIRDALASHLSGVSQSS